MLHLCVFPLWMQGWKGMYCTNKLNNNRVSTGHKQSLLVLIYFTNDQPNYNLKSRRFVLKNELLSLTPISQCNCRSLANLLSQWMTMKIFEMKPDRGDQTKYQSCILLVVIIFTWGEAKVLTYKGYKGSKLGSCILVTNPAYWQPILHTGNQPYILVTNHAY